MQTTITKKLALFNVILCAWLASMPYTAFAHDGPPRLELSANQVNPGAVIEVSGINLAPEALFAIVLVRDGSETQLGQALSDAEGDFSQVLTLPVDLSEGEYSVQAVSQGQAMISASLKIEGAAMAEEGEQRDEEEPLLAPMPTRAVSAALPSSQTTAASPLTAVAGEKSAAWLFVLLGTLALAGLALALKRRSVR